MNRRDFLKTAAAASATATLPLPAAASGKPSGMRPNVLYVFSDQHRAASLPGEAFSRAVAPTFDRFRRENFSMDACISNYPLCAPHRGILISGLYPQQSGLVHNAQTLQPNVPGLGDAFQQAGYHTAYVGKWHLYHGEGEFVPKGPYRFGFEHWRVWANTNRHYDGVTFDPESGKRIVMHGYQPTRMTDQAIEFLDQQKGAEKPWLLVVSWNPPHPPFNPPADDKDLYTPASFKFRPNVRLPTPADDEARPWEALDSFDALREAEQGYYGGITAVDKEFARLLRTLDENGMADDTIVVYTSDHGEMMGSHGHMAKQMPHEESCRVPFFVRLPGMKDRGGTSDALFSSVDIYPTLCGLAGIAVPKHCSGRDFSNLMRGDKQFSAPDMVFLMNEKGPPDRMEVNTPTYRGVRTATHTYAVQLDGRWFLYDNNADPYQMKNLVKDPASKRLIEKFDKALIAWSHSMEDGFPYDKALKSYSSYPSV
jgi:arylsulfatase A-like enzyme